MPTLLQTWALPASLLAVVNLSATLYNVVSKEVTEPYLDEFFHIPQAQKYCIGDYTWDPKITTPPGLYLVAKLFDPVIGCDIPALRALNIGALCLICPLSYGILRLLRIRNTQVRAGEKDIKTKEKTVADGDSTLISDAITAFNVPFFPPLFFFSALFYTDVMSTLVVLLSYGAYLRKNSAAGSISENVITVSVGIMALLFRQTNIFWVAIFPAGLSLIDALRGDAPNANAPKATTFRHVLEKGWNDGYVHDCSVQDAGLEDYLLLTLTVAAAVLQKPVLALRVAMPYIILIALFAGFVLWNGSVVLGDKTAHTATLHLPQMLYVWPYIAFFSAPLLIGPALQPIVAIVPQGPREAIRKWLPFTCSTGFPRLLSCSLWTVLGVIAVHFNTVVHPYTLADNRHYVFYVFRILRRYPAIRYLAVPLYVVCAWLTMQALAPSNEQLEKIRKRNDQPTSVALHRSPCRTSFILIWLVTTALSVISAPLVEPRYFIIPWVMWRLHVPSETASFSPRKPSEKIVVQFALETVWMLVVNVVIAYVFLHWTFEWSNEPGKLQRFLW